jgi:hypothetical protein
VWLRNNIGCPQEADSSFIRFVFFVCLQLVAIFGVCLVLLSVGFSQTPSHNNFAKFRPRQEIPGVAFLGSRVCAGCHAEKSRTQLQTSMAHALSVSADNTILQSHPRMTFRAGNYSYEIVTDGNQSTFSVSDGKETISEPIPYIFGKGNVAHTFVLRHNGKLYEGRVSYYSGIGGLDWTMGDSLNPPPNLIEAFGRDIDSDEARNCFSCHGTAAVVNSRLQLDRLVPGVGCEDCHGPGEQHLAAMTSGTKNPTHIFNPKTLNSDALSQEFCGACHRSADTVGMMPDLGGPGNVRFQPYRILLSRGHNSNDKHFACTACHDPHNELNHEPAWYDAKCTVCHAPQGTRAYPAGASAAASRSPNPKPCPVNSENCVTCHMPKVELKAAHFKFTDHRIRIARPNEPYPF